MAAVHEYIEETLILDGVAATRRRKISVPTKTKEPYLHIPMKCVQALGAVELSAGAFSLALWIIWHYTVTRGETASISAAFVSRAGIIGRSARRYAIISLKQSGLFDVRSEGKQATKISPSDQLKNLIHGVEKGP